MRPQRHAQTHLEACGTLGSGMAAMRLTNISFFDHSKLIIFTFSLIREIDQFSENTKLRFWRKIISFRFSKSTFERGHFAPKIIKIGSRSSENEQIEVSKFGNTRICRSSNFPFFY